MNTHATAQGTAASPWMTAEQAASYLGLPSIRALYQAVRRGQVPARRLGRRLRFLRQDLDATLAR
jgi:excisionase family DNA binding protein